MVDAIAQTEEPLTQPETQLRVDPTRMPEFKQWIQDKGKKEAINFYAGDSLGAMIIGGEGEYKNLTTLDSKLKYAKTLMNPTQVMLDKKRFEEGMTSDKYEAIYNNRTREWTKETTNLFKRHRTNIRNEEIATSNAELRRMGADTKRDRQYNTNVGHYGGAKDRADFLTSNIPDLLISKHIAKKDDPDTKDVDEKGKEVTVDLLSETNTSKKSILVKDAYAELVKLIYNDFGINEEGELPFTVDSSGRERADFSNMLTSNIAEIRRNLKIISHEITLPAGKAYSFAGETYDYTDITGHPDIRRMEWFNTGMNVIMTKIRDPLRKIYLQEAQETQEQETIKEDPYQEYLVK